MSWYSNLDQIEDDLKNGRILLSSALIHTANAMRGIATESVLYWLNRELTGYDPEDVDFMKRAGWSPLLSCRNVDGIWGLEMNGLFIEKGATALFIGYGINEIEAILDAFFDISVFETGDFQKILNAIDQSAWRLSLLSLPLPEQDAAFKFTAMSLLNVYRTIGQALCEMIQTIKESLTGSQMIKLDICA